MKQFDCRHVFFVIRLEQNMDKKVFAQLSKRNTCMIRSIPKTIWKEITFVVLYLHCPRNVFAFLNFYLIPSTRLVLSHKTKLLHHTQLSWLVIWPKRCRQNLFNENEGSYLSNDTLDRQKSTLQRILILGFLFHA